MSSVPSSSPKPKPLDEDAAFAIWDALLAAGFVGGIGCSIWGSADARRWEVRATPTADTPLNAETGVPIPDRWDDETAIWGARR